MSDSLAPLHSLTSLTVVNAKAVLEQGLAAIEAGQDTIDLGKLDAVDSGAVSVMLAWRRAAQKAGQPLHLKNLPPNLKSLTKLYGVCDLLFDVPDTVPDTAPDTASDTAPDTAAMAAPQHDK
jgi:phospholipid transport system transporter-binding protein